MIPDCEILVKAAAVDVPFNSRSAYAMRRLRRAVYDGLHVRKTQPLSSNVCSIRHSLDRIWLGQG